VFFYLSHISLFISHKAIYYISSKKLCYLHVLCSTCHCCLCLRPCDRDIGCFFVPASVSPCYLFCCLLAPPLGVLMVSPRPHTFSFYYSSLASTASCMLSTLMALKLSSSSVACLPAHVIVCLFLCFQKCCHFQKQNCCISSAEVSFIFLFFYYHII